MSPRTSTAAIAEGVPPPVRNHSARKPPRHPKRIDDKRRLSQRVFAKFKGPLSPTAPTAIEQATRNNRSQHLTEDLVLSSQYSLG
ncbi:hypothetical protein R1flu_014032 [Riccia fluitans]|uniref:Uncharacterized protein n=1 Tax=Riccia fluitans TaxID=41844 RepID=A0ABD1YF98_9MARC